jgi:hypothetical protein
MNIFIINNSKFPAEAIPALKAVLYFEDKIDYIPEA